MVSCTSHVTAPPPSAPAELRELYAEAVRRRAVSWGRRLRRPGVARRCARNNLTSCRVFRLPGRTTTPSPRSSPSAARFGTTSGMHVPRMARAEPQPECFGAPDRSVLVHGRGSATRRPSSPPFSSFPLRAGCPRPASSRALARDARLARPAFSRGGRRAAREARKAGNTTSGLLVCVHPMPARSAAAAASRETRATPRRRRS